MSDDHVPRGFGGRFHGLVARAKAALRGKDSLNEDELRFLIAEDGDVGPIALPHSPNASESDEDLDVLLEPPDRSRTQEVFGACQSAIRVSRRRLWVVFGILCLSLVTYATVKTLFWNDIQPIWNGPTTFPEYSTALGCLNASYVSEPSVFEIPVPSDGTHLMEVTGSIVGTLVIVQGDENATQVQYEMKVMAAEERTFNVIRREEAQGPKGVMRMNSIGLSDPDSHPCQRFDITVHIPPNLRHLTLKTEGTTHLLFDRKSTVSLSSLTVDLKSHTSSQNLILSHMGVQADSLSFSIGGGWISGNMLLVKDMSLIQSGSSAMLVDVVPSNSPALTSIPAVLRTQCGGGRSHITHRHFSGATHRRIDSVHSATGGWLEIAYQNSAFEGSVEVTARQLRASGRLSGAVKDGNRVRNKVFQVGIQGEDRVRVESQGYVSFNV
ncbi:uncharacterized protein C8Q71DRAFT_251560 [Rhodofomes roseus]|uniref:Adhesin domain-containing protein n=1 Tax=Rhodofomes roseus TaxID=34475 RepID=A0ABQ8K8I3_9APHY|nr:uncharacterized protein C8Q71DRAFT_251560 [Rhodofomes roseus]KAH9833056.1 hypothetical protein C8Q71DRAFT_251560 [Rhodofomes roseus]